MNFFAKQKSIFLLGCFLVIIAQFFSYQINDKSNIFQQKSLFFVGLALIGNLFI